MIRLTLAWCECSLGHPVTPPDRTEQRPGLEAGDFELLPDPLQRWLAQVEDLTLLIGLAPAHQDSAAVPVDVSDLEGSNLRDSQEGI